MLAWNVAAIAFVVLVGAVGAIDDATQQDAALVEQATAAANAMRDQAAQLQRLVASFVLDPAPRLALALENGVS